MNLFAWVRSNPTDILAKAGVGRNELARIAVPGGDQLAFENGTWTGEKNPRLT